MARVVLYIHGAKGDDKGGVWRRTLDKTFGDEDLPDLEARGYTILSPSYLALLRGAAPSSAEPPVETYKRGSDDAYTRAAGAYWLACSELEAALAHVDRFDGIGVPDVPLDALANVALPSLFKDAETYCSSPHRRHAIQRSILSQIPSVDCELVIIAHSLGSLIAVDMLYHLPTTCKVTLIATIGSPLAHEPLRRHLRRLGARFPYERTGPWLNLVGGYDYVTVGRGISRFFPEALDVYIDTGTSPRTVHTAKSYLAHPSVAVAIDWVERYADKTETARRSQSLARRLSDQLMVVVVGAQHSLHLRDRTFNDSRTRLTAAREIVLAEVARRLRESGEKHPVTYQLAENNASLLEGAFQDNQTLAIALLLSAHMNNPIAPYEIELPEETKSKALESLARDMSVGSGFAEKVIAAEKSARKAHRGSALKRVALGAAGLGLLVVAPMAVFIAAPAGLAGGAAIVAGLAALGPGGMLGGLAIVGAIGGVGGGATIAALAGGTPGEVGERVIFLQAHAKACADLNHRQPGSLEWFTLTAMESQLAGEHARLASLSDPDSNTLKDLRAKLKTVRTALEWLAKDGLGPPALGRGEA